MASETQRYPLAAPDGTAIPLEVFKPLSFMRKSFTTTVSGTLNVPAGCEIMSVMASADCFISFGGTAAVPPDGSAVANLVFLPKILRMTIAPPTDTFTVIGDGVSGNIHIQFIDKWASVLLQTQVAKR